MKLPRYPKYKDSGVKWLGQVPEHWKILTLKYLTEKIGSGITPRGGSAVYSKDGIIFLRSQNVYDDGLHLDDVVFISEEIDEEMSSTRVKSGDILLNITGASLGRSAIVPAGFAPANVNQHVCIIRLRGKVPKVYISYLMKSAAVKGQIAIAQNGAARDGLNFVQIGGLVLAKPIEDLESKKISQFLDEESAKIDALIVEQQHLIELLKEKRQAIISQTVTKGLNPDAPMKPSGIEWLGDIPRHWKVKPTKRLFRLIAEPAPDDNEYELLSIYTDIGVRPRKDLEAKGNKASTTDGYWIVRKGDLIVNKLLAWMGAIGISEFDGVTSPAYDILRKQIDLDPHYYDFLFRCGICFSEFRRHSRGIMDMRLRLYFDQFGRLPMPYPPPQEQIEIVESLGRRLSRIDALIEDASRSIEKLNERRTALISAAVTGEIDVRSYQPREVRAVCQ